MGPKDGSVYSSSIGTYEELMLGVKGKGKGKRGRVSKKGGSKIGIDEVMELGYGKLSSNTSTYCQSVCRSWIIQ